MKGTLFSCCISGGGFQLSPASWVFYWLPQCAWQERKTGAHTQASGLVFLMFVFYPPVNLTLYWHSFLFSRLSSKKLPLFQSKCKCIFFWKKKHSFTFHPCLLVFFNKCESDSAVVLFFIPRVTKEEATSISNLWGTWRWTDQKCRWTTPGVNVSILV